ncbi:unnamed protein product [Trichobilharzia szidati]|nr:unnamed protein product [Trichobilharzia szidati]
MYRRYLLKNRYFDIVIFLLLLFIFVILISYLVYISQGISLNYFEHPLDVDLYMIYENEFKTAVNKSLIKPINPTSFHTILSPKYSCELPDQPNVSPELVVFVKSALMHFESRNSIRKSWGNPNCFLHFGVRTRTLFVLGRSEFTGWEYSDIQGLVNEENSKYGDIVQFDFVESYHNVTYKLIATLNFAVNECSSARFLVLIDDDFIMHPPNLLQTISEVTETHYPTYIAGDVLRVPRPVRIPFSKWFVPYSDYPYSLYPPFPSGGTILLSKPVAQLLSVGLRYTKLLPFEDVVIGLVLYKLGISPVHLDGVFSVRFSNGHIDNLISIHGFRDHSLFRSGWNELGLQNICKD